MTKNPLSFLRSLTAKIPFCGARQPAKPRAYRRVKTPTLLQIEAVECGAAALGIILAHYQRIVPLSELRQACGVSRDGSKAINIVDAAKSYDLQAKGFKKQVHQLWDYQPPFIVFWNFNHFLVVEGRNNEQVFLNDPALGHRAVSIQEFDGAYTGIVLVMQPSSEFKPGGRKPNPIYSLWKRLHGSVDTLAYCTLAGFLLVLPGLALPMFTQFFIDHILMGKELRWLSPLILVTIATITLITILRLIQQRFLRQLKIKLWAEMSSRFLHHLLHLPVSFYSQRFAGEIGSRIQINRSIAEGLSGQLALTIIDLVMIFFYVGVMWLYDGILTLIGVTFSVANVGVWLWVSRRRVDLYTRLSQDDGKVKAVEISTLQSIETLKASALEADVFSRWSGYYAKRVTVQQELEMSSAKLDALPVALSSLMTLVILTVGGLRVMDGHLSLGMLIALQSWVGNLQKPINTLVGFAGMLQQLGGNIIRLDDVLHEAIDPQTIAKPVNWAFESTSGLPLTFRLRGEVELRNVTFGYSRLGTPLVEDLSLTLKPGQRVALVGGSGSGKSTIAKLVAGLYEPWSGEILFDGVSRKQIPRAVLANSIAMVEQDIFLFGGTVRENLTLWDETTLDSQVVQACKDAAIHDTVLAIPRGYDGDLLEGAANLSGGQRQRLEIARALVNDPAILIMDEATSALDAETEKMIDQALRCRGCTCIIVAHRLSTIRDSDQIIVLEQGKVVQRGTHKDLWETEGLYAQLLRSEGDLLEVEA